MIYPSEIIATIKTTQIDPRIMNRLNNSYPEKIAWDYLSGKSGTVEAFCHPMVGTVMFHNGLMKYVQYRFATEIDEPCLESWVKSYDSLVRIQSLNSAKQAQRWAKLILDVANATDDSNDDGPICA